VLRLAAQVAPEAMSVAWSLVLWGGCILLGVALAWRLSPEGRTAAAMCLVISVGVGLYGYVLWGATHGVPMQFGDTRTPEGLVHVLTRGQYESLRLLNVFTQPVRFAQMLGWYLGLLDRQFLWHLGWGGLLSALCLVRLRGAWLRWLGVFVLTFVVLSIGLILGAQPAQDVQDTFVQERLFIPSFALWAVLAGVGISALLDRLLPRASRPVRGQVVPAGETMWPDSTDAR